MTVALPRTVRDILSAGRAYLGTDTLVRLLPVVDPGAAVRADVRDLVAERDRLEAELLEVADGERQRIGSELHDDLGQLLAAIALLTTGLESTLARQGSSEADTARRIRGLVEQAIDHTGRLARDLATLDLGGEKLVQALRGLAAQTRALFDVACVVEAAGEIPGLDTRTTHQLYKIAQEAITNAIKHGPATRIVVTVALAGDELVLAVRNDGTPIPAERVESGRMGLRYMRHRAAVIGATLDVRPDGDRGTIVRCVLTAGAGRGA